ncbi:unnamed protein product [Calypogeia fissa]
MWRSSLARTTKSPSIEAASRPCKSTILYEKSLDLLVRGDVTGLKGLQECDFMCFVPLPWNNRDAAKRKRHVKYVIVQEQKYNDVQKLRIEVQLSKGFCFCIYGAEVTTYRYVLSESSKSLL